MEKRQDENGSKKSNNFVKRHALEIGLGAAALAAAVIGGIYYMKRGKGEDAAEAVVKKGEEILKGAEQKASKTLAPEVKAEPLKESPVPSKTTETPVTSEKLAATPVKTENQAEVAKPAKPTEEPKPVETKPEVKDATPEEPKPAEIKPEEIKSSNPALTPVVIKEAQELLDGAPKNFKEIIEETQKQVDNYDFIKNPFSTDFESYRGEISDNTAPMWKDIFDENGKRIMKVRSDDGKKVSYINLFDSKTEKEIFSLSYSGGDKLRSIEDVENKKLIYLYDNKIDFINAYEGNIFYSDYIYYSNSKYNKNIRKLKYDKANNSFITKMTYHFENDLKTINCIRKYDDTGKKVDFYNYKQDGTLDSVVKNNN